MKQRSGFRFMQMAFLFVVTAFLFMSFSVCGEAAANGSVLKVGMGTDILTFDPQNHQNTQTDCILTNMSSLLFRRDELGQLHNELVETCENIDSTRWRFTIKQGVKFHNGDVLTAEDVKFTLERAATDKKLKEYPRFKVIKEVDVSDDHTFDIVTYKPVPYLRNLLAKMGSNIMPKKYIEEKGMDNFLSHPVFSGPYMLKEWIRDDRVVLVPFKDYFGGVETTWDEIHFRAVPESSTRVGELLTGGLDIITQVPPNEWDRINGHEGTSMVNGNTTRIMLLVVRMTEGYVTADPKIREAIDLAINKEQITRDLLKGSGIPCRTRVAPGVNGHNSELFNTSVYDLERARQLLKEAGYPNGIDINMDAPRGRYLLDSEVAQFIAGMLGRVGIRVHLNLMEPSTWSMSYGGKKNKELFMIGMSDPMFDAAYPCNHYCIERAKGETDFHNQEANDLYIAASSNLNLEERSAQFQRIQEIAAEERPHICLYLLKANYGVNDRIDFTPRNDEIFYIPDIHSN